MRPARVQKALSSSSTASFLSAVLHALCLTYVLAAVPTGMAAASPAGSQSARSSAPEVLLRQAKEAEAAKEFERAAEFYVEYLKAKPQQAEIYQRLGLVYYLASRFGDAIPALRRAMELDPQLWGSALFLGICLYRTGQFQAALAPLRHALKLKPELPEGLFWLGSALFALGQIDEAVSHLEKIPSESPLSAEAGSLLVQAYRRDAELYYQRIEDLDPDSYRAHQLQAESLAWKDRDVEAIAEFRKALERNPRLEGVYRAIGDLYWKQGSLEAARKAYESELRLTPLDEEAHLRLGQYWLAKGQLDQAARHLESVLMVSPNSSEAHRDLAQVWLARGDLTKAEALLETAVRENPDDPYSYRLLADVFLRTDRPAKAKEAMSTFEKLSPNQTDSHRSSSENR